MAAPMVAGLPPWFNLESGYSLRVTAQNPTDGSTVSSVIVSNVSYSVDDTTASSVVTLPTTTPADFPVDTPWLVPLGN